MTSYVETIAEDTAAVSRTFNPANQLITSTNGVDTTSYVYDDDGNLVEIDGAGTDGDGRYGFNQRNMLISNTLYVDGTGWVLQGEFRYDGDYDRLQQVDYSSGTAITTTYTNDATGLTNVLVADDGTTQTYMLFGLDLIAQDDGTEWRTLLADGLGSTRTEMVGGDVETVATYEPYGKLLVQTGSSGTVYGYTGEAHDASSGLVFLRARYYSPELKLFLSRDPYPGWATSTASQNGYSYAHNNPINYVDSSGLCAQNGDEACWSVYEMIVREFPQAQTELYLYNFEYIGLAELPENRLRNILSDLRSNEANPNISATSLNGVNDIIRYFETDKQGSASERLEQLLHETATYKIMGLDPMMGLQFGVVIPGGPGLCEAFEDKQYFDGSMPEYEQWRILKQGANLGLVGNRGKTVAV